MLTGKHPPVEAPMPLLLTEADVRTVLPMADLIEAMEQALRAFSAGDVQQPVRPVIEAGPQRNYFAVMPAAMSEPPAVGVKVVTLYHGNLARGLPSHLASILLLDPETGALAALMDGRYITEARTAAVSAVSVRWLARADATSLAILGSGVQARSHLEAIGHVRSLTDVRVWSPTPAHREAFAAEMAEATSASIRVAGSAAEAAHEADIIALTTASPVPILDASDVAPGTHVVAVGASRPDQREMTSALVARSRLVVDSRDGAMAESGDVLLAIADGAITQTHIAGELGEVVLGRVAGRGSVEDVTAFKSLGMAVEDVVAARLVVERAAARGIGHTWSLT